MSDRLKYLFDLHLAQRCTPDEEEELFALALEANNDSVVKEMLQQSWEKTGKEEDLSAEKAQTILTSILRDNEITVPFQAAKVKRMNWRRIAVAASVLLAIGTGGYFLFINKPAKPIEVVNAQISNDVKPPATNRAMITLANGKTVYLDSAANGTLATQGSVQVVKLADGQIAYNGSASGVMYNTLTNPRGSKVIDMALADGSHVWLNAGSSVTYPIAFAGGERNVSVTGEAYFEVAHDKTKPFYVTFTSPGEGGREGAVQVLGTHFNVNAYDDESDTKVTLLEGSVKINSGSNERLLKPGQQAQVTNSIQVTSNVDLEQVMAWKNGSFQMKGTDLASLMRQIARWYDVQVVYENTAPKTSFGGSINRDVNLSDVLKALEQYGIESGFDNGKVIIK